MENILIALCIVLSLGLVFFVFQNRRLSKDLGDKKEKCLSLEFQLLQLEGVRTELEASRREASRFLQTSSEHEGQAKRIPMLEQEKRMLSQQLLNASTDNARLTAEIHEQQKAHARELEALTALREDVKENFKILASDSFRENQKAFLALANETFEKHKQGAVTDLEARQEAVGTLIEPVVRMLNEYQEKITTIEKNQHEAYGTLSAELKQVADAQNSVRNETAKLVNALRSAPKTRGRWGEHTLKNVIELAGLSAHCDFSLEQTLHHESGVFRPDLIVKLPGARTLVVDAKTSLQSYLDAVDAVDEVERDKYLQQHAAQLRSHAKQLGSKAYWEKLNTAPDFVVMFIPGDNFYSAAAERDPTLFEDAASQRVLIVTPATLIALAKAVAYGWRQEKIAENTKAVHQLGRDLYKRLSAMGGHIQGVGRRLGDSVKHYNEFIGSLEGSVMPQARKFNELEVEGTITTELPALPPIEQEIRLLAPDRDVLLPASLNAAAEPARPIAGER